MLTRSPLRGGYAALAAAGNQLDGHGRADRYALLGESGVVELAVDVRHAPSLGLKAVKEMYGVVHRRLRLQAFRQPASGLA